MVLGGLHILRALGLPGIPWGIRLLLPWALYRWWGSEELFRLWGKATFAPMQLKVSGLNTALGHLGVEQLSLFDPVLWREIEPGWGVKLAGLSLLCSALVTLLDLPVRWNCHSCRAKIAPDDVCCHACGYRFPEATACHQCGRAPRKGDRFCRSCGTGLGVFSPVPAERPDLG